ncbi:hypothetical protein F5X68DRAFT_274893 [Plectosphaerella plurivora]|uniref:Uncharacterized protein n=1 Tax=Plectosphaerella plurivora TaxID=936078 RepID=A0A9P9ADP8_9PEZI|nr:hypothetical protein F5X68DRAFT_274893 [Plectosphaerella plurivora]
MPTEDTDDSDPKKLKSIFTFQKGVNAKGQPYFTVSQVVAASGIVFRGLPDVGGIKSRKIAESNFKEKAVLGALVLIDKNGGAHILKTATSANVGEGVELLDTVRPSQLLWQPLWRKRVIKLGPMLKLKLGSIYDSAGAKGGCKKEDYGRYHASHVEKKLATFLLYMMLNEYGIKVVGKYATCDNIRKLNRRITSDPRRIRFELLISRKWCGMCLAFIRRLSSASGIEISLRVQPVVDATSIPSRDYKDYSAKYTTKQGGPDVAKTMHVPRMAQDPSALDMAFTEEELQAFDDLELDDGQDDMPEDDKKAKAQGKQAEAFDLPLRLGLSESYVPVQNEEGDELFCPLYDAASKAELEMATTAAENKRQADMGAELATLTIREEYELFGTPGVGVAPMADMGEYGHPRLEGAVDRPPVLTYPSPEPAGDGGDEDDLFLPLNPAYTVPAFPAMQQSVGPASPSPESQSPTEETPEPVVIDISETPPPPSAAQVAAFARNFAAPFLYKSQNAASATTEARPRKKPKPVSTARERVFQKKPLPATPVTTEPVGLRDGAVESPKNQGQAVDEYDFAGCEDPVFTQLEIERYG